MDINFDKREKQFELFQTILAASKGDLKYKYIYSGGAIRGAKSFTNSLALLTLCKMYPNSKWAVIRKDLTILETTTIETINKIIAGLDNWKWNRNRANYHLTYSKNGSRILFIGANESRDKDYTDTLGLEINGVFFDQLEDVSYEYYNAVLQRLGSWHIPIEPKPIVLTTFNPHPGWIKKEIYLRYKRNKLKENEIYFPLSPYEEPSNSKDQWEFWGNMPIEVRARMIDGDWDSFDNKNPYFYALKKDEVIVDNLMPTRNLPLILSFDFNINPATCVIAQIAEGKFIHIIKSYRINDCTLKELCMRIKTEYPRYSYRVTGDPSGNSRNQGFNSPNETMYSIIRKELNITYNQIDKCPIKYAGENAQTEIRIFVNTILQNHPNIRFDEKNTNELLKDLTIATTKEGEDKMYKTSGNTEYGMHLSDCFIYLLNTYLQNYIKLH